MSIGTVASTISWRIGASSHLRIDSTRPSVRRSSTIPRLSFRTESPFASRRGILSQPALDSASVDILYTSRPTLGTFSAVHRALTRQDGARLYVDPKTAYPVKLDVVEPHYLWGQVHVEVLYGLWEMFDGSAYPRSSFRIVDGSVEIARTVGTVDFLAAADAPALGLPDAPAPPAASDTPLFLQPLPPDTVRAADDVYLLKNPGYTEAVALVGDTVFVFDATQAAERARQDHEWIQRLFPGEHPVVVVVTDLAWPHIAGVRYWVAQGATILSHRMSE